MAQNAKIVITINIHTIKKKMYEDFKTFKRKAEAKYSLILSNSLHRKAAYCKHWCHSSVKECMVLHFISTQGPFHT